MKERLQKIIASAGIDSRRHAEKLITAGRVSVNGVVVKTLGTKADPAADVIRVDGKIISVEKTMIYVVLNKPAGYVTTLSDPEGRPTVVDLIRDVPERIYPVGRLDYDSAGLLLMTNDGDFALKMQHPAFRLSKLYRVKIQSPLNRDEIKQLSKGIKLADGLFKPENVQIEKVNDKSCWVRLVLREGKNRIIRRGFEAMGHRVARLVREAVGSVFLGDLKEGSWRYLTDKEVGQLLKGVRVEHR